MPRYIDADAVIKEIEDAQDSLKSNNDVMWEINKKYYKGLCMAHRIVDEQPTADVAPEVEQLIYKLECLLCHATGNRLSKHTYDLRTMESAVTDYVEKCCDEARAEAKDEVANEIFAEFELHIRKAVEGWQKQLKFEIEKYKMDMIMARLDAFGYCIYVLNNLREKYTEGETDGNGINKTV